MNSTSNINSTPSMNATPNMNSAQNISTSYMQKPQTPYTVNGQNTVSSSNLPGPPNTYVGSKPVSGNAMGSQVGPTSMPQRPPTITSIPQNLNWNGPIDTYTNTSFQNSLVNGEDTQNNYANQFKSRPIPASHMPPASTVSVTNNQVGSSKNSGVNLVSQGNTQSTNSQIPAVLQSALTQNPSAHLPSQKATGATVGHINKPLPSPNNSSSFGSQNLNFQENTPKTTPNHGIFGRLGNNTSNPVNVGSQKPNYTVKQPNPPLVNTINSQTSVGNQMPTSNLSLNTTYNQQHFSQISQQTVKFNPANSTVPQPPMAFNKNVAQHNSYPNTTQPSNLASFQSMQNSLGQQSRYSNASNAANFQTMQNNFTNMSVGSAPAQGSYGYGASSYSTSQLPIGNIPPPTAQNTNYLSNKTPPSNLPQSSLGGPTGGVATLPLTTSTNVSTFANRYPVPKQQSDLNAGPRPNMMPSSNVPHYPQPGQPPQQQQSYNQNNIVNSGFNQNWNRQHIDLLQTPNILPPTTVEPPRIYLGDETLSSLNCSPDIIRSTLTKIPDSNSLLQKSRLPLGILIHPFRDLSHLPVIQCNVIVRCRSCRTYINPFVYFVDSKRWKCNICYRINELPEEFQYDPVTKTYGDPSRRPEIKSSTIEYIAPAEYMLRPPQPAIYIFLLDISRLAVESGYLTVFCSILKKELQNLPGDTRTQIGLLAYDSALHFYLLSEGLNQPQEMIVLDIDDAFLPAPDGLLVNLKDRMEMIVDILDQLPEKYKDTYDMNSALGPALQVAHKMINNTGGRITVFQASLPNVGPGALTSREDPNQRSSAEVTQLNPANDFYKRLALECSSQQIAVDLFILNSQYVDLATISGISRFSGGCIHHFPLFKSNNKLHATAFENSLRRYLLRKIGFEAVMRVRCTRGLTVHTFHGNFFVRSTDLLSLPNINPDSAFGLQIAIEESLSDIQTVCFQAALLYTSSKGERRIRVHTICMPVVSSLNDVIYSADQQAIIALLAKMAVDRSMQSSLADAREAFINVAVDILSSYKMSINLGGSTELLVPDCLKLLPLLISAIMKHPAFRVGSSTRLDDRIKAMIDMKTKPLHLLIQQIYPDMYAIHNLEQTFGSRSEDEPIICPPKLHLSARCLENKGAFLLDIDDHMLIWIGASTPQNVLEMFGVKDFNSIPVPMSELPDIEHPANQRLHQFISYLNDDKPYPVTVQIIRDDKPERVLFLERLIEDRLENSMSYHEFLQHLKMQIK